jgi:hypothetical protein
MKIITTRTKYIGIAQKRKRMSTKLLRKHLKNASWPNSATKKEDWPWDQNGPEGSVFVDDDDDDYYYYYDDHDCVGL